MGCVDNTHSESTAAGAAPGDATTGPGPRIINGEGFDSWVRALHFGAQRSILINGIASAPFPLVSGLAQGCCVSPCIQLLAEESKAAMVTMTAKELAQLQAAFPASATLQDLRHIRGLRLPGGRCLLDIRYAGDFNAVVMRDDLDDFFKIVYFCGKGSGATLNESKTYIMWIGTQRDAPPWPEAADGEGLTVLGVEVGYGAKLRNKIWDDCIAASITNLRACFLPNS
jgi:hypothetical protein